MGTLKQPSGKKIAAASALSGMVNGLFGSGGGILAVVVLERLHKLETGKAHATALMVMLPLTVISILIYMLRGRIEWAHVPWVALGMLIGSFIGAKLLGRLNSIWVDRVFCLLMLAAGVRLLF